MKHQQTVFLRVSSYFLAFCSNRSPFSFIGFSAFLGMCNKIMHYLKSFFYVYELLSFQFFCFCFLAYDSTAVGQSQVQHCVGLCSPLSLHSMRCVITSLPYSWIQDSVVKVLGLRGSSAYRGCRSTKVESCYFCEIFLFRRIYFFQ